VDEVGFAEAMRVREAFTDRASSTSSTMCAGSAACPPAAAYAAFVTMTNGPSAIASLRKAGFSMSAAGRSASNP
jgi:hypothetical protein